MIGENLKSMLKSPGFILTLLFVSISTAFIAICFVVLNYLPRDMDHGSIVIIVLTIIFTYFVATPIIIDIVGAYAFEYCRIKDILQKNDRNQDDVLELLRESMKNELSGVRNLTRAMIALGIILIIGVATGFIILNIYKLSLILITIQISYIIMKS